MLSSSWWGDGERKTLKDLISKANYSLCLVSFAVLSPVNAVGRFSNELLNSENQDLNFF